MGFGVRKSIVFLALAVSVAAAQSPRTGGIFDEANKAQASQPSRRQADSSSMQHVKMPTAASQQATAEAAQQKKASAAKPEPAQQTELPKAQKDFPQDWVMNPAPKPDPLRPSQMPAVAPRVSYQMGQLTVVAENSTFADVISSIRSATNIPIEATGGPSSDRVAVQIGPAPVKQVLLSLVEGSKYDYVIVGSETDPNAVVRVLLTPKAAGSPQQPQPQPQRASNPNQEPMQVQTEDDDSNEGFATPVQQNVPNQAQPAQVAPTSVPGQANPAQPKSPEQLMEELKRLEEQRRQQQLQQTLHPPNPGSPTPQVPLQQQRPTRPTRPPDR